MNSFPKTVIALVVLVSALAGGQIFANDRVQKTKDLKFKAGTLKTSHKDTLQNGSAVKYRLTGQAGQVVVLQISSRPFGSVVPINGEIRRDDGEAVPLLYDGIERWSAKLPKTGNYSFSVRQVSKTTGRLAFTLTVFIK